MEEGGVYHFSTEIDLTTENDISDSVYHRWYGQIFGSYEHYNVLVIYVIYNAVKHFCVCFVF